MRRPGASARNASNRRGRSAPSPVLWKVSTTAAPCASLQRDPVGTSVRRGNTFVGRDRAAPERASITRRKLAAALRALARRRGATLFMTLLAVWQTVLGRLSGQTDVAVGMPVANRGRSEIEGLVGFFVNMLALRTDLSGDPSFEELLGRIRRELADTDGVAPDEVHAILTGGLSAAPWVAALEGIEAIDPELTLKGLAILYAEVGGGEPLELGLR